MPLAPGTRIGSHVVVSLIGEGGMGEVYRARDLALDREVAIKRLPDGLANDPDRLARFEREARTLASLNHPNVAQIYAVESGSIVMEMVPGQTLSGPLPLDTALRYAAQIASALDAAHERGIIHRDLKPGNVIVTPDGVVKVLDFGLAARDAAVADSNPDRSPTITAMSHGVILGTAAYMAPEQASGKPVDKRADIFAFGVVLWEMLTGRRMYEGETTSHILAAVLTHEPDLSAVPPAVRPLLARCLEKDPKKRLRDIGDAMSLVSTRAPADTGGTMSSRQRLFGIGGWLAAAALIAIAVTLWPRSTASVDAGAAPVRFSIPRSLDLYNQNATAFAVSPDGSQIAYHNETSDGQYGIFVRTVATGVEREIAGAPRFFGPRGDSIVWSPDGRRLVRGTQLSALLIDIESGATRTVCECRFTGGAWNKDDVILLGAAADGHGIHRGSVAEWQGVEITRPDAGRGESDRWPVFLPDGRRFLFTRTGLEGSAAYVGSLDGDEPRRIGNGSPRLVVTAPGRRETFVIGIDEAGAVAHVVDPDAPTLAGPAVTLSAGATSVSGGSNGIIAVSGRGARQRTVPTWFDRSGRSLGPAGPAGYFESVALSDDGRYLAMSEAPGGTERALNDIWIYDTLKGVKMRLTFDPTNDSTAAWSPDGRRVVYTSRQDGKIEIFQRNVDGTGDEKKMFDDTEAHANDWSADGKWLLYSARREGAVTEIFARPIAAGEAGAPMLYVGGPRRQQQATFSPDGRYVAYGDDRTGTFEVYVQPFPEASNGKWMISSGGGTEPRWSHDGRELFFLAGQTLMSVPVRLTPTFSAGTPVALFETPNQSGYTNESDIWQVAPDGKRFLMLPPDGSQAGPPLQVIVNWQALLKP
jgi:serine/threonine protein kinase